MLLYIQMKCKENIQSPIKEDKKNKTNSYGKTGVCLSIWANSLWHWAHFSPTPVNLLFNSSSLPIYPNPLHVCANGQTGTIF